MAKKVRKLTWEQAQIVRRMNEKGWSQSAIARWFHVTIPIVNRIVNDKSYRQESDSSANGIGIGKWAKSRSYGK